MGKVMLVGCLPVLEKRIIAEYYLQDIHDSGLLTDITLQDITDWVAINNPTDGFVGWHFLTVNGFFYAIQLTYEKEGGISGKIL